VRKARFAGQRLGVAVQEPTDFWGMNISAGRGGNAGAQRRSSRH